LFVCLSASSFAQKNFRRDLQEIVTEGWKWAIVNKKLNFGDYPGQRLDIGIVFLIRRYWELRKVVNGHISAAHILIRQMAALV